MKKLKKRLNHLEKETKITDEDICERKLGEFFEKYGTEGIASFFLCLAWDSDRKEGEDLKDSVDFKEFIKTKDKGMREELIAILNEANKLENKKRKLT